MVVKTVLGVILKSKKVKGALKFLKKEKGGVEAVTGVAPTVSKKLSEKAMARSVYGWAERMQSKLKNK